MSEPVPAQGCPDCGILVSRATAESPEVATRGPKPGDVLVCVACGAALVFDEKLLTHRATARNLSHLSTTSLFSFLGAVVDYKEDAAYRRKLLKDNAELVETIKKVVVMRAEELGYSQEVRTHAIKKVLLLDPTKVNISEFKDKLLDPLLDLVVHEVASANKIRQEMPQRSLDKSLN